MIQSSAALPPWGLRTTTTDFPPTLWIYGMKRSTRIVLLACCFLSSVSVIASEETESPRATPIAPPMETCSAARVFRNRLVSASRNPGQQWLADSLWREHGIQVDVTDAGDVAPSGFRTIRSVLNNANDLNNVLSEGHATRSNSGISTAEASSAYSRPGASGRLALVAGSGGCDFDSDSDLCAGGASSIRRRRTIRWYAAKRPTSVLCRLANHTGSVTGLPGVRVLLRLDESTFEPVREAFKTSAASRWVRIIHDWTREFDGGRFFYTELGDDLRSLDMPFGRQLVCTGLRWTAAEKKNSVNDSVAAG